MAEKPAKTDATPQIETAPAEPDRGALFAAAAKIVEAPVLTAKPDRKTGKLVVETVEKATPAEIHAARLDGADLVAVTVDGQRFRAPAPKSLTA